jgi:CRP-like cAMP-binding protein
MNKEPVLINVAKHIILDADEQAFFMSLLEKKVIGKKEFLLQEGDICRHTAFVNDGALRSFTVDDEGHEHILSFAMKDWWIADLYSLITQRPAVLNIEAIPDTEVLLLSRENQEILYRKIPKFERFFRILVENALVANQQRLIDSMSVSAEERYLRFIERYPSVPVCVPQHNIASYLGITPEFLSKIRARLTKKK